MVRMRVSPFSPVMKASCTLVMRTKPVSTGMEVVLIWRLPPADWKLICATNNSPASSASAAAQLAVICNVTDKGTPASTDGARKTGLVTSAMFCSRIPVTVPGTYANPVGNVRVSVPFNTGKVPGFCKVMKNVSTPQTNRESLFS